MNELLDQPVLFTIFGSTGDLTFRKLIPAFYNLEKRGLLGKNFKLLCIGRREWSNEEYLKVVRPWVEKNSRFGFNEEIFQRLSSHIEYVKLEMTILEDYKKLADYDRFENNQSSTVNIYYLAVAPNYFSIIADNLKNSGQLDRCAIHRVVLEKPFGEDLAHARNLNEGLCKAFGESNVYRIDHYLGKEMIQNIMTLRFANRVFEGIWNNRFIENVQITASEIVGVENRGAYYDNAGALKDMVQNHLFQILSFIAMEKPTSLKAEDIRQRQSDVLENLRGLGSDEIKDNIVFGQYTASTDGTSLAYRQEENVAADSATETFIALKLEVDSERWKGVPFYIKTGKRLDERSTYVSIQFKPQATDLFVSQEPQQDLLIIKIQPDEGVYFRFNAKKPGTMNDISTVFMNFCQSCIYENRINTPEAYERLLLEAVKGDDTLFASWHQVELTWHYAESINLYRKKLTLPIVDYTAGSDGPDASAELLKRDGREWIRNEITEESYTES